MSIRYLYTVIFALILLGCSSHEELPPPDNPFDPGNPDYVDPEAEIISGPTEGEIVDSTAVTLVWEGNESATEYRYKFDSITWSDWGETTSQTFDYLDEGIHSLQLQARSVNGDEQTLPTLLDFEVDAVAGPSVLVYPYLQSTSPGDTITYQIIAEEVTDLFAVECELAINGDLEFIEIMDGELENEWGGNPLIIEDIAPGEISISMVSVEGVVTSFTGTTTIFSIRLRVAPTFFPSSAFTAIQFSGIVFLDPDLEVIHVAEIRAGVLDGL